jgi:Mce-associated membrane protein
VATFRSLVVGVAIALLVVAVVLAWQGRTLREDSDLDNRALLDKANQERVVADVSRGLTQVLSYDYTQPEATRAFADQVLKGQAREEYDKLFEVLEERASGQELTMAAQVQVAGVQELTAERRRSWSSSTSPAPGRRTTSRPSPPRSSPSPPSGSVTPG